MVEVIWSPQANKHRECILAYGQEHFGIRAANKLNERFEQYARLLGANPWMGYQLSSSRTRRRQMRRLVVNKLFSFIYYVDVPNSVLYIVAIYDARRNPDLLDSYR